MEKIRWCMKKRGGIKRTEPSGNLFMEYIGNAEESLRILERIKDTWSNMWLATTKYYSEYFAFYALLMKLGIKCEIHDCTIELARWLEAKHFVPKGTAKMLEDDKELRIENQYYLKNKPVEVRMEALREFVLAMKTTADKITREQTVKIRSELFGH
jgi:uncharacterized protein (UPF0332 family)